ncbi:acyl acyl-carrier-protein thioesterase type B [Striga asiatica]|uniref:Acyl-[acyl-carrier-protein] hydrolase n=1 Tax=Striga asiatica TaxID=4170 RepID=A0A5A7P0J3_STRAF|nr:acyl acyl-carrier-protein thioesterase type B [Striga asiatica]
MVTTAAACLPIAPISDTSGRTLGKISGGVPASVDARGTSIKSRSASSGRVRVKANAQAIPKVNGTKVGTLDGLKTENEVPVSMSPPPRTFINQLPDWSMLLAAITTIFLAAEKQWMMLDWKPKRTDMLVDPFGLGRIVQDGLVFRQNFSIRSYEIGADRTASVETLMNHLQETALNHVKNAGLLADGFGSTPEMCKRNLIWVVTKMQVLVDRYPTWGDVVQVDTWVAASGKNGMRRDWLVRDSRTGDILTRASRWCEIEEAKKADDQFCVPASVLSMIFKGPLERKVEADGILWVMMNKETRRLSKIPDEVREEIGGYFVDSPPTIDDDNRKLPKLDDKTVDYIRSGLTPRWSDLDVNQHVNNVKYVGWILESAPLPILETHELAGMTLEYRRECMRDSVLQSLTSVVDKDNNCAVDSENAVVECQHLLRLEGGAEIVKGRTVWRPKYSHTAA